MEQKSALVFAPFSEKHLAQLMTWIQSETQCRQWGGPQFRYPFDRESFSEDCRWRELPSFVLEDSAGRALAFGQYYNRLDCCHLGRLVVAPDARGCGLGCELIANLVARGCRDMKLEQSSLFVLKDNQIALALYEKLGYRKRTYPEPMEWLDMCHYLVAPANKVLECRPRLDENAKNTIGF